MRIVVKLFASLSDLLPAGSRANSMEVDVPDQVTAIRSSICYSCLEKGFTWCCEMVCSSNRRNAICR